MGNPVIIIRTVLVILLGFPSDLSTCRISALALPALPSADKLGSHVPSASSAAVSSSLIRRQGWHRRIRPTTATSMSMGHGGDNAPAASVEQEGDDDNSSSINSDSNSTGIDKYKQQLISLWRRYRQPAMYLGLAFGVGYQWGWNRGSLAPPLPEQVAAETPRALRRRLRVAIVAVAGLVARDVYRSIPQWLKRGVGSRLRRMVSVLPFFGNGGSDATGAGSGSSRAASFDDTDVAADPDDMTDPLAIYSKWQGFMKLAQKKLNVTMTFQLQASFVAMLQLADQSKVQRAHLRDDMYSKAGRPGNATDLAGLDVDMEFADWAYDESPKGDLKDLLAEHGYALLKHDKTTVPGFLGHYVAVNKEKKVAVIGIKGTSSMEDLLTDASGAAVTHQLDGPFVVGGASVLHCHEGVLISSRRLADDIQPFVEDFFLPQGYIVKILGHSLGAGAACLVAIILRSRIRSLLTDGEAGSQMLRVLAFASPPILDYDNALATRSFTTTIINNSDIVTRASIANMLVLVEFAKVVNKKLDALGLSPSDFKSSLAYMKRLAQGKEGEMILDDEEYRTELDRILDETLALRDPDHLYVPGQVIMMYSPWEKTTRQSNRCEKEDGATGKAGNDTKIDDFKPAEKFVVCDGGAAKVLRYVEIDERMLNDHLTEPYKESISSLMEKY